MAFGLKRTARALLPGLDFVMPLMSFLGLMYSVNCDFE